MEWHPFAEKFGWIPGDEWPAFLESIRATGGNEEPVRYRILGGVRQGLDGRNRERACLELGLPVRAVEVQVDDADVKAYIVRQNVHRRHLDKASRRAVVAELRADGQSTRQIAETLGIGKSTVARDIISSGVPNGTPEPQPAPPAESATVTGKDGKTYAAKKPAAPKKQPPAKPKDPVDGEGNVIPERLRDVFADGFLAEAVRELKAWHEAGTAAAILAGVRKRYKHLPWLRLQDACDQLEGIDRAFELALETLRQGVPYAVCQACNGDGCDHCRHAGYLSQWAWEARAR